ncbi:MAG: type II toxin-antitoxin system HicA family toxin [Solirubrobacterales bacterium]|nr:type II toxin-antitoxin system HicA family toxin [Solirubrobacterales bacterium]
MKRRDLERHLIAQGCAQIPGRKGPHEAWENPDTGARSFVPRHREIGPALVRGICRQLGITVPRNPH